MHDRIRLLLVDDAPHWAREEFGRVSEWLQGAERLSSDVRARLSSEEIYAVPQDLAAHFELRLVESVEAAKEFRDLSVRLEAVDPRELGEFGWVPELVLVDYDLSEQAVSPAVYGEALWGVISPLVSLRHRSEALQLPKSAVPADDTLKQRLNRVVAASRAERDRSGCFAGGLIVSTFDAHPCVPVPTTVLADDKVVGRDGLLFEWLLNEQYFNTYDTRGGTGEAPDLRTVIGRGVKHLRERLEHLVQARTVWISYDDLVSLSTAPTVENAVVRVESRYGLRSYAVEALFVDYTGEAAVRHANDWAHRMIEVVLRGQSRKDLDDARELAEGLWEAYTGSFVRRVQLSDLHGRQRDAKEEADYLERVKEFGVEGSGKNARCRVNCDITSGSYSARARRWAALFIMVRLAQRAVLARDELATECEKQGVTVAHIVPAVLRTDLDPVDVYFAVFPLPERPIVLTKECFENVKAKFLGRLGEGVVLETEEGSKRLDRGNLGLTVDHVLRLKAWSLSEQTWGLKADEPALLQQYAKDIGFRSGWPGWLNPRAVGHEYKRSRGSGNHGPSSKPDSRERARVLPEEQSARSDSQSLVWDGIDPRVRLILVDLLDERSVYVGKVTAKTRRYWGGKLDYSRAKREVEQHLWDIAMAFGKTVARNPGKWDEDPDFAIKYFVLSMRRRFGKIGAFADDAVAFSGEQERGSEARQVSPAEVVGLLWGKVSAFEATVLDQLIDRDEQLNEFWRAVALSVARKSAGSPSLLTQRSRSRRIATLHGRSLGSALVRYRQWRALLEDRVALESGSGRPSR